MRQGEVKHPTIGFSLSFLVDAGQAHRNQDQPEASPLDCRGTFEISTALTQSVASCGSVETYYSPPSSWCDQCISQRRAFARAHLAHPRRPKALRYIAVYSAPLRDGQVVAKGGILNTGMKLIVGMLAALWMGLIGQASLAQSKPVKLGQ